MGAASMELITDAASGGGGGERGVPGEVGGMRGHVFGGRALG